MKTQLIQIGKVKAVKIPAALLMKTALPDNVEITALNDSLVVRPIGKRRAGWSEACLRMRRQGDDRLLDGSTSSTTWDQTEWEW